MSEQLPVSSLLDDNFSPANSFSFEARKINDSHQRGEYHIEQSKNQLVLGLDAFVEAGNELIAIKKKLPHGQYLPWLKANVTFSHTTASQYIKIAEALPTLDANLKSALNLLPSITSMMQFLTAPDAVKKEVFVGLTDGETMTGEDIKRIKADHAAIEKEKKAAEKTAEKVAAALEKEKAKTAQLSSKLAAEQQSVFKTIKEKVAEKSAFIKQKAQEEAEQKAQNQIAQLDADYIARIDDLKNKVATRDQQIQRLQAAPAPSVQATAPSVKDPASYERSAQSVSIALNTAHNNIANTLLLKTLKEGKQHISDKSKTQLLAAVAEHKKLLAEIETILS